MASSHRSANHTPTATDNFTPDWNVPPGTMLRAELHARGITQADLASRTGLSAKHINQVIQGLVSLSPDVAVLLERTLGIASITWTRMEALYQDSRSRTQAAASLKNYEPWTRLFPRHLLIHRGIIKSGDDAAATADKLLRFFRVADPDAFERVWLAPQAAYRRSQIYQVNPYATAVWLRLVEIQAEHQPVPEFHADKLRVALPSVRALTLLAFGDAFARARNLLAGAGVRLVFVPEIERTRICGATRWLGLSAPVIALTNRHKFADVIWFTFVHEAAHIVLHPRRATFIDIEGTANDDADQQESAANKYAANLLLPDEANGEIRKLRSLEAARNLAVRYQVSPGIVAGRYGHLTDNWRTLARLRITVDLETELIAH